LTAVGGSRVDGLPGVIGGQVHRPDVRHLRALAGHASGDEDAAFPEIEVATELLRWLLRGPAEQLAVELPAALGIRGHQIDPAGRCDDRGVSRGHGDSFRVPIRVVVLPALSTLGPPGIHRSALRVAAGRGDGGVVTCGYLPRDSVPWSTQRR